MCRAVITGKNSKYQSIADLKGTTFGISRLGRRVNGCVLEACTDVLKWFSGR